MRAVEYLKRPYGRLVTPDSDEGTFLAEIFEFPGCYAVGETAPDALAKLEEVAVDWIDAALEQGQSIPEPMDNADYSGKLVLRMSKGMHKKAAQCAEREGVSLNSFIANCVAEQVGLRSSSLIMYPQAMFGNLNLNFHMSAAFAHSMSLSSAQQLVKSSESQMTLKIGSRNEVTYAGS